MDLAGTSKQKMYKHFATKIIVLQSMISAIVNLENRL